MNTNIGVLAWMTALLALAATDASLASASDENRAAPAVSSAPPAVRPPAAATRISRPEVWLCAGDRIVELLRPDAEWSFVKQHLNGIKLYVDQINDAKPDQLQQLVRLVKEYGYQVAVELGCCLDFAPMDDTAGEWSARHELAKIEKLYAAGGKVDFLDLDGPVRRLMHPEHRRDGQSYQSMEKAANEVVDSVRIFHRAHPEIRFWHLTNFPNWGYKGDVSYHARGPKRQDYGEYDDAHRLVYEKLKAAGIGLSGVTIDNPHDYLMGEHFSVNLKDPKSVNWLKRVRDYEDRCRAEGLEVNLIANSERGGFQSDEMFCRETLQMVDSYLKAGGQPTRWFVQTWYPHPKQMVPETASSSMTGLVKAVIQKVRPTSAAESRREVPASTRAEVGKAVGTAIGRAELAKWDDAGTHRSQTGPGGTEWDAHYRSLIQTDDNATSKGFPTHGEAARAILADAIKGPENLRQHKGWVLFIKHFSEAYRPESATAYLKRLYEDLVELEFGTAARSEQPFAGDPRLIIHRDVMYGRTHPDIQKLDAYLLRSPQPAPAVMEIHGGGWRRGSKSQFVYRGNLIGAILDAGVSIISIDYRLTPEHTFPAQMDDVVRAVQFVRSRAKEWNVDPDRIGALGGSAGAHLAAWVALHDDLARSDSVDPVERLSSRLACFVALSGPMDLTRVRPSQLARQPLRGQDFANAFTAAFGCTAEQYEKDPKVRQRVREGSPLFLVTRDDPPALVVGAWGEDLALLRDPPVPAVINDPHSAWHGVLLAEAMRKAGVPVVVRVGPEVGKDPTADNAAIVEFLRERLCR